MHPNAKAVARKRPKTPPGTPRAIVSQATHIRERTVLRKPIVRVGAVSPRDNPHCIRLVSRTSSLFAYVVTLSDRILA